MKVVLAYSGGLDTSVILKFLQEKYGHEVITVTLNVGQRENWEELQNKAYNLGTLKHYTIDARESFVKNYAWSAVMNNALYQGSYPLATSLTRPLMAQTLVNIARREGADAVVHGCTGMGNDQIRFELGIKALAPELKIIAPVREEKFTRDWEIEYAKKHDIPVSKKIYSIDENLWGRSIEGGVLEDPKNIPPEEIFRWVSPPEKCVDMPEYVEIGFEKGIPVSINGLRMDPITLVDNLNNLGGRHGIGIIDHIESRVVGIKSREVYEAPAATMLIRAHRELEKMVLTKRMLEFKEIVDSTWTNLVYQGLWYEPLRESLDKFTEHVEQYISGSVKLKLYKGGMHIVGRYSPNSLYDKNLATYESGGLFNQEYSRGFIEIFGLESVMAYRKYRERERKNEFLQGSEYSVQEGTAG